MFSQSEGVLHEPGAETSQSQRLLNFQGEPDEPRTINELTICCHVNEHLCSRQDPDQIMVDVVEIIDVNNGIPSMQNPFRIPIKPK